MNRFFCFRAPPFCSAEFELCVIHDESAAAAGNYDSEKDRVLDVICDPGGVACALAKQALQVEGMSLLEKTE
jgi:2-polyprenyl-3-methyl-5-hydroxy-6-metoxy-1,4-benzoquinol methylase